MPSRLPRLVATTGLAVTVLVAVAACSQGTPTPQAGSAPAAEPGSTAQFGDGPAPATPVATATKASAKPAAPLADGRWPGYLSAVSSTSVSMDLIEFLTGDAAAKAWKKKYPESEQDTPDNDYFIVNDNKKVRKLPLASPVTVTVVGASGPGTTETVAITELKGHFGELFDETMFWLTVKQGKVTRIEQQFLP